MASSRVADRLPVNGKAGAVVALQRRNFSLAAQPPERHDDSRRFVPPAPDVRFPGRAPGATYSPPPGRSLRFALERFPAGAPAALPPESA